MVSISREDNHFIFEVKGMHKLWALKSQLSIPADNIIRVHRDMTSVEGWKGWRSPGTSIPSILTAGTFYKEGKRIFWDVSDMDKTIIIDLKDEEYNQLVIEVADPEEAITQLSAK